MEVYVWKNHIFAFLELMDGGNLTSIIRYQLGEYSEQFCKYVLHQVALGLHQMHKNNILHRDIKSANILCNSEGQIKIADLGFSICLTQQ